MSVYQQLARRVLEAGVTLSRLPDGRVKAEPLADLPAGVCAHFEAVPGTAAKVLRELEALRVERVEWPAAKPARSYAVRVIRPDGSRLWIATDERAAAAVKREAAAGELVLLAVEVLKAGELADWETVLLARRVFPEGRIVTEGDRETATSHESETPRGLRAAGAKA